MNDNEKILKTYLKESIGLNENRVIQEYQGLHKYEDVENEFVDYILHGWKENNLLEVEGLNAKILNEKYPLSVLGAYNYLIYLREYPYEALENLRKGLPKR